MCFVYQPEDVTPVHLAEDLQDITAELSKLGASLVPINGPTDSLADASFAVCNFDDLLLAARASSQQIPLVSWLYVLDCVNQRQRLSSSHVVRVGLPLLIVPHNHRSQYYAPLHVRNSLPAHCVKPLYATFTAIKGVLRVLVSQLFQRLGIEASASPHAHRLTHIVAGDVHDTTSNKIVVVRRYLQRCAIPIHAYTT